MNALQKKRPAVATAGQEEVQQDNVALAYDFAKRYAQRGWQVIPVKHGDKRPLVADWPDARLPAEEIARWFDCAQPPNLGILCGEPSRLVVLDFDDAGAFAKWQAEHSDAAATLTVARDNAEPGRCHLYFRLGDGEPAPDNCKFVGGELLSTGRQVVAPPSVHASGGRYRFAARAEPLAWRPEYPPEVAKPEPPADCGPAVSQPAIHTTSDLSPYVHAAVADECATVAAATEGARNDTLCKAAFALGQFVGGGALAEHMAESRLLDAARQCGLGPPESRATVKSGLAAGMREPRQIPESRPGARTGHGVLPRPPGGVEVRPPNGPPDPWPSLETAELESLPDFPWDCLPPVLGEQAQQVARTIQVPPELPAFAALTVAGFAMGHRTFVSPKRGVKARPNLYVLAFLASGERKSTAYAPMVRPLERYAAQHDEAWERVLCERRIYEAQQHNLERELAKPGGQAKTRRDLRLELQGGSPATGTSPHYLVENATEEYLATTMVETGERAAVFTSDARDVLQVIQGLYTSDAGNRESLYLASFDGETKRIGRVSRGPVILRCPSISCLLLVQCDKLPELGGNAGLWEGGFLPRFIMLHPDSLVGTRLYDDRGLCPNVAERYDQAILHRLAKYRDQDEDVDFPLSPKAKDAWVAWYNSLEQDMAAELAEVAAFASRWQNLPFRLGAIIAEFSDRQEIAERDMLAAIDLCGYVLAHERRCLAAMKAALPTHLTRAVRHIRDKEMRRFKANDLRAATRATAAETAEWLDSLAERGYVRKTGETDGHKRTPLWEANPQLWRDAQ